MNKRELVMLAHNYDPAKHSVAGMMLSEKLDGMRALWIPETKGLEINHVGFANRERDKREHRCSGLWSRYGKVIHCPASFTENLPSFPLDGELWIGRGTFQRLMSVVKHLVPSEHDWKDVSYKIFDAPSHGEIYRDGQIRNPNYSYKFENYNWSQLADLKTRNFENTYYWLKNNYGYLDVHEQIMLPFQKDKALSELDLRMDQIVMGGGEGIVLRNPSSLWEPIRSHALLKVKPYHDDEAKVIGYVKGKGKYDGMLGSLIVEWGKFKRQFELSGMTDAERLNYESVFPVGCIVTFRYREVSDAGIPKEARFLRNFQLNV